MSVGEINSHDAKWNLSKGNSVLVCAYMEDQKFQKIRLKEAISFRDFASGVRCIPKDKQIIFYCDTENESLSRDTAEKATCFGFDNIVVLKGGFHGWGKE
ncbi:MAG: rhodanese-like domain-containing protein [Synergistales bacterium]|nr:rhodanese-like domain-containing protein [Synergistales bacterium]